MPSPGGWQKARAQPHVGVGLTWIVPTPNDADLELHTFINLQTYDNKTFSKAVGWVIIGR